MRCNQECLAVRGRALAGRGAPEGASGHWSEREGRQRVAEVVGRVEAGSREALEPLCDAVCAWIWPSAKAPPPMLAATSQDSTDVGL